MTQQIQRNRVKHRPDGTTVIFLRYKGRTLRCWIWSCDYSKIEHLHWTAMWAPDAKTWYAVSQHGVLLHRLLLPGSIVDHKNHRGLDCRVFDSKRGGNIRPSNSINNARNSRKRAHTSSRYKGVYLDKRRQCWNARIQGDGYRRIWLGSFRTQAAAGRAYDAMARKVFGVYALLNFGPGNCRRKMR